MRLPQGERQLVEIAKALSRQARLIIFDEPTTSLTARETERLFEIIGRLRAQGISIIYISHILGDVLRLCDEIAVLRDGQVVGAGPRDDFTIERLVTLMVGRTIDRLFPEREPVSGPHRTALSVRGVSQPGIVKDVSFDLNLGEVLGVSGLMGSGRSELARILFGLDPYSDRRNSRSGRETSPARPARCDGQRHGLPDRGPSGRGPDDGSLDQRQHRPAFAGRAVERLHPLGEAG